MLRKLNSRFFMLFLVLGTVGLVLTDWGGYFRNGVMSMDVAHVGSETITLPVFEQRLRKAITPYGISPEQAFRSGMVSALLTRETGTLILMQEARAYGLLPSDKILQEQIARITDQQAGASGMDRKQVLDLILRDFQGRRDQFVKIVGAEVSNTLLRNAFMTNVGGLPQGLVDDQLALTHESRDIRFISLPFADAKLDKPADDAALKTFYEARKDAYKTEELRGLTVALLPLGEKRTFEQALFADEAKAKTAAEAARKSGSLKDAVKGVDKSGKSYQGENAYTASGMPAELAQDAFSLEKGKVLGPVKTALGWHVLKLVSIDRGKMLSDAPAEALADPDKRAEWVSERTAALEDALASGATLEDLAKEHGLDLVKVPAVSAKGSGADEAAKSPFGALESESVSLLEAAFSVEEGESAPLLELSDGSYAAVRVDTITPAGFKPFEDVRSDIEKRWTEEQKEVTTLAAAQDLVKQLEDGSKALPAVATERKLKLRDVKGLTRQEALPEGIGEAERARLFDTDGPGFVMVRQDKGVLVAEITHRRLADVSKLDADARKEAREGLTQALREAALQGYVSTLADRYGVTINAALLQSRYGQSQDAAE